VPPSAVSVDPADSNRVSVTEITTVQALVSGPDAVGRSTGLSDNGIMSERRWDVSYVPLLFSALRGVVYIGRQ